MAAGRLQQVLACFGQRQLFQGSYGLDLVLQHCVSCRFKTKSNNLSNFMMISKVRTKYVLCTYLTRTHPYTRIRAVFFRTRAVFSRTKVRTEYVFSPYFDYFRTSSFFQLF